MLSRCGNKEHDSWDIEENNYTASPVLLDRIFCKCVDSFGFFQVLSVTLDEWSDEEVDSMIEIGGNASANSIYEAFIPEGSSKPGPDASHDQRMRFIR